LFSKVNSCLFSAEPGISFSSLHVVINHYPTTHSRSFCVCSRKGTGCSRVEVLFLL
jgi:hypothetical protein